MIKKLSLFTFLFLFALANNVFAHTGLTNSSPQNGEVITEELQQITLTFETKIEQGSTFTLQHVGEESIAIENISLQENQLIGNLPTPLENGEYQVHWNIIGADGHPIEGDVTFTVELPVTETPTEEPVEPHQETEEVIEGESTESSTLEQNEVTSGNAEVAEEVQQTKGTSNIMPVIIGILIVILIGSFFFIMKRKK